MKLEAGQVAVVTGGANGIGLALAHALRDRGVRVVLADNEADSLERAVAEVGGDALAVPTDVADPEQVNRLAEVVLNRFGRVDLLFNNAGTGAGGLSWTVDSADWQRVWSVNVGGATNGIHAFLPHMIEAGRGHIVNTSSMAGLTSGPFNAPYSASKHAVVALTEALRIELAIMAPEIGVTVVCPGPVDTRMLRGVTDVIAASPAPAAGPDGQVETGWLGTLTPVQATRLQVGMQAIAGMIDNAVPADRAAEIILTGVEADRLYVSTDPEAAPQVRARMDAIVADLDAAR